MNAKKIKLVISDLDGTILQHGEWANSVDKNQLIKLQQKGYQLTIATGQGYVTAKEVATSLEIDKNLNLMICNNGGYLTTVNEYQPFNVKFIPTEMVRLAATITKKMNLCLFAFNLKLGKPYWNGIECPSQSLRKNSWWSYHEFIFSDFDKLKLDDVLQLMIFVPQSQVHNFESAIEQLYIGTKVAPSDLEDTPIYEVNSIDSTKGNAVKALLEKINIKKEEAVVFGDGQNDVTMFQEIPNSVAMANASQEIIKIAKYKTKTNIEAGVSDFLKNHFNI